MLFFVKVRIDLNKLPELGQKLRNGELDVSSILHTYCLKDDPSVGMSVWEADSEEDFNQKIAPHKKYYAEVMEISPVVTSTEAKDILSA